MLKRHLKTAYNMTPESYRERWGLAADYPMVAPNYARQRSKLAKESASARAAGRPRRADASPPSSPICHGTSAFGPRAGL